MFLGLRTVIYPAPDLAASKAWFTTVLGIEPYFDEPFHVGYNVGGYEIGLDPHADPAHGVRTYWGVPDLAAALAELLETGATIDEPLTEVGDGIKVATVREPVAGSVFGLIENPVFVLAATDPAASAAGPGR